MLGLWLCWGTISCADSKFPTKSSRGRAGTGFLSGWITRKTWKINEKYMKMCFLGKPGKFGKKLPFLEIWLIGRNFAATSKKFQISSVPPSGYYLPHMYDDVNVLLHTLHPNNLTMSSALQYYVSNIAPSLFADHISFHVLMIIRILWFLHIWPCFGLLPGQERVGSVILGGGAKNNKNGKSACKIRYSRIG